MLRLLDRQPRLLDAIDEPRRPQPDAPEGSPEWFALQRILGLMERAQNLHRWSAVVAAYDLDGEWIDAMIGALLLSRAPGAERAHVTAVADIRFRLHDWAIWFQGLDFDREPSDPASVPLMPGDALLAAE